MVHLREYSEPLDLIGNDLMGMIGRSREEVSGIVGKMATKAEMQTEELPAEFVISLAGEFADEVHEWPNATLGPEFRHLMLQFREDRLVHMRWKFQGTTTRLAKPWWKFW